MAFFCPGIPKTSFKIYSNEELNFFKFASVVLNEFPEALREIFVDMWDTRIAPHHHNQVWDDSVRVHNLLLNIEGPKTKIPKSVSFRDWDCTALFQATLYAKIFALPDSKSNMKTLGDLYLRNRKLVPGQFHSLVASPSGDANETTALAIDQLRLLRNTLCHSSSPCVVKGTFDDYVKYAKEAFTAVNLSTNVLETIGNLAESDFPIATVEKLNEKIQKERNDSYQFLKTEVKEDLEDIKETTEGIKKIETKMDDTNKKLDELLVKKNAEGMLLSLGLLNNGFRVLLLLSAVHDMQQIEMIDGKLEIIELFT